MNANNKRKRKLLLVVSILLIASIACFNTNESNTVNLSENVQNGGEENQPEEEGPDIAATEAALAKTQSFLETEAAKPPPATDTPEPPKPTATEEPKGIDWNNLKSGDVFYATDFNGPGDWEDGWSHFATQGDDYSVYVDNGVLFMGVWQKDTYAYAVFEDLYVPRGVDVVVEVAFDNVGDVRNNNVSIICRASERGWYEFSIATSGLWFIWKFDGSYDLLANGGIAGYDKNDTDYVLSASCIDDELTIYIDGQMPKYGTTTDSSFREGFTGVSVSTFNLPNVEVEFDWFQVWYP